MSNLLWRAAALLAGFQASSASAEDIVLARPITALTNNVGSMMPAIARKLEARYTDADRNIYLDNLFRLQLVAGEERKAAWG